MAFRRVFGTNPGDVVLSNIESVDVIDTPPPSLPLGAGVGAMLLVGEFERYPLEQPVEIFSSQDQTQKIGGLGFESVLSSYDGAVARQSGGNENWNGNGFIWLRNKRFSRLIVCRVDNSAGEVAFSRLPCLTGGAGPFAASDGDQITFDLTSGAATATATVNGAVAELDATGATYPIAGGLVGLTIEIVNDQDDSQIVTFGTEVALVDIVARINAVMARTIASDNAGQLRLSSVKAGSTGYIQAIGGTALSDLGLPTAVVQQVSTWTAVNATAGSYTLRTVLLVQGQSTTFDATFTALGTESATELRDLALIALEAVQVPGVTQAASGSDDITSTGDDNIVFTPTVNDEPAGGDITIAATTAPVVNAEFGTGNVGNLASFTVTEAATFIDGESNISSEVDPDGNLRTCGTLTAGTGTIEAVSGALVPILGYAVGTVVDAAAGEDVTIAAGTIVEGTSPATRWVTMIDIETGAGGGPFAVKVRPWEDTDVALANTAAEITNIISPLPDGFAVTNAATVTRLTGSQLDAAYTAALAATLDLNTPSADADFVAAARTSESIIAALKVNADTATQNGLAPRKALTRPPLGTTIANAQASTGVGVANSRNERAQYAFPGVVTRIPEIQAVGSRGGTGFTDNGIIEVGADGFLASIVSILPPEENAGQNLGETNVRSVQFLALEDAYNKENGGIGLTINEYIAFKAAGITAPLIQGGVRQFQSDVTTVDPTANAQLADGSRRRLADFIIKSSQAIAQPFVKKLNTTKRRLALKSQLSAFLRGLESPDNEDLARIDSYDVQDVSSEAQRANGIQVFDERVKSFKAMLTIVLNVEVGATVVITEA